MSQYALSIVTYFDILGFRQIVAKATNPEEINRKLQALKRSSSPGEGIAEQFGNTFTNFSDLVVRTVPVSSEPHHRDAGLLYGELMDIVYAQVELIREGVLLRGAVTIGEIFVQDEVVFGPALIRAYEMESQVAVQPRVIVNPYIFKALAQHPSLRGNPYELELQYLSRIMKMDVDGVWFVDYLRAFAGEVPDKSFLRFLEQHRRVIKDNIASFKRLDSVGTKYAWLMSYHNAFISQMDDEKLEQLGSSKGKLLIPQNLSGVFKSIEEDPSAAF